jgi:diguanylate cyclase (GGDEF)-like protein
MKVLVAEDNVVIRNLLEGLLGKWGHEVIVARNGEEAWCHLQREDGPRLAIVDWMMPGTDGLEVCRRVRAQKRSSYVYIILLSARSESDDIVEAFETGADDYMTKPFHASELRARTRSAVRILELQEALARQAYHDTLTGLPNRRLLADRLEQALHQASRHSELVGCFFIDLDRFKTVNDCLGHAVGDDLLQQVASRLKSCVRECDTLARVGGDEFVLVACNLKGAEEAPLIATRLAASLEPPFEVGEHPLRITASIGVVIYPYDGNDMRTLQQRADRAMYESKRRGQGGYHLFASGIACPKPATPRPHAQGPAEEEANSPHPF